MLQEDAESAEEMVRSDADYFFARFVAFCRRLTGAHQAVPLQVCALLVGR